MSKKNEEFQKHTLHLFTGDFQRLGEIYPEAGASAIIRKLVHAHLSKIDQPVEVEKVKVRGI